MKSYGGIGTYVRLGPKCPHDWGEWIAIIRRSLSCSSAVLAASSWRVM